MTEAEKTWSDVLSIVETKLSTLNFNAWFRPTRALEIQEDTLTIGVPNRVFKGRLQEHVDTLRSAIRAVLQREMNLLFVVDEETAREAKHSESIAPPKRERALSLNPKYTFENFVVGPQNRFSYAAAYAVAESPSKAYNPLFIYGGVGLGKTHLMQAIGNEAHARKKSLRINYVSSEQFVNEMIASIQQRQTQQFRAKYRHVDLLLVDDIQFLANKESTQEEFFHTFNALHDAHKQIVISSDAPPKEIPTLQERLISRFEWGLIADIKAPDLETRTAIVRKKAEASGMLISNEVAFFIASTFTSNIRELEGALVKILAYSRLNDVPLSIDLAREILRDVMPVDEKDIDPEVILRVVASYYHIRPAEMRRSSRSRSLVVPRQVAMYAARRLTNLSLPEIAKLLGRRDHTTVIHACKVISNRIKEDSDYANTIDHVLNEIRKRP